MVSCLAFSSLIHFEFIFVYGVRKSSMFVLLYVAVHFSQHHLLKELSFFSLDILSRFVEYSLAISLWVHFWVLYSVPLMYVLVLCQYHTVLIITALLYSLRSEIVIPPALVFVFQCDFGYLGAFLVPYKF